jgi:hypothetical protein
MRYVLRKRVLDVVPRLEIDAEEYERFKAARRILTAGFAIEENYEVLISNYQEFETTILESAAFSMLRDHVGYGDFFDTRITLNRRLINLFTTTRLYLDHIKQHIAACASDPLDAIARIDAVTSEQYDGHREYRFMDAFRNYVQHRGIPIHWISHGSSWTFDEDGEKELMQFSVELVAEASVLRKDSVLKARPLAELEERTDLTLFTRRYIECLSTIHDAARHVTSEPLKKARELMEDAHKRYMAAGSEDVIGLSACMLEDDRDVEIEHTALLLDWDDVRVNLQKRNRKLVNLHRRYVTGASTFQNKPKRPRGGPRG